MQRLVDAGATLARPGMDEAMLQGFPGAVAHVVAADDGAAWVWVRALEAEHAVDVLDDVTSRLERLRAYGGPPPGEPWERSSGDLGWFLWLVETELPDDVLTLPPGAVRGVG
jgi:hypothetical protein